MGSKAILVALAVLLAAGLAGLAPTRGQQPPAPRRMPEPVEPAEAEGAIQFSFANQPWERVLEEFARRSGLVLQMEARPPGAFNYVNDPQRYTMGQAIDVLNTALMPGGHYLIRDGRFLKVIALEQEGVPAPLVPRISPAELDQRGDTEVVSVVFPLRSLAADEVLPDLQSLLSKYGKISALRSVNRLAITDAARYVRLVRAQLEQIDLEHAALEPQVRLFPLRHSRVSDVAELIRTIYADRLLAAAGPDGAAGFTARSTGRQPLSVGIDERSNQLIISCSEDLFRELERLIRTLDRPAETGREAVHVVIVRNSTPSSLRDALERLQGSPGASVQLAPPAVPLPAGELPAENFMPIDQR